MTLSTQTTNTIKRLNRVATDLKLLFSRRDTAVDLMKLALLCHEHVLLLGPPGSGKSELVSRFARGVKARSFQYLLTRFTEPAELFGPVDIQEFQKGRYHVRTEGMLPEAQIAFLDEVFQASSAILNTLLSLVHERIFYNGAELQPVPLLALFGASNTLPDDPTLRAFSDRFALRLEIEPIPDESLGDMLEKGWDLELERINPAVNQGQALLDPQQLELLYKELAHIGIGGVLSQYQEMIRRLRAEGVQLTERRMVKGLKLIRGAALLDGRSEANVRDLWPLNHMWNNPEDVPILRQVVQPLVEEAGGPALDTHRLLEDLVEELELLEGRAPALTGEGAFTVHLSSLAQIRRELLLYHVDAKELLQRVERLIQQQLEAMRAVG
jgi:MoxR-like ATPase